jgi:hypothetical protein
MKLFGRILMLIGAVVILWSVYIFLKYLGSGGDNSYTPYSATIGLVLVVGGFALLKRRT